MTNHDLLARLNREGSICINKFDPEQGQLWADLEALAAAGRLGEDHAGPSVVSYFLPTREDPPQQS